MQFILERAVAPESHSQAKWIYRAYIIFRVSNLFSNSPLVIAYKKKKKNRHVKDMPKIKTEDFKPLQIVSLLVDILKKF